MTDENSSRQIWGARKSALNTAMKLTVGSRKPLGLIEDTVVNPNILYDYTRFLLQEYNDNKLDYVIYGHAGNGNLHTRPLVNIESQSELEVFDIVANEVFTKVISCGGTITGEHGDGIARTKYIEFMYGSISVAPFMSWVLAAVITTDNGMPFLSVNTCLLVPSLPLSVGLGPVLSPLKVLISLLKSPYRFSDNNKI